MSVTRIMLSAIENNTAMMSVPQEVLTSKMTLRIWKAKRTRDQCTNALGVL